MNILLLKGRRNLFEEIISYSKGREDLMKCIDEAFKELSAVLLPSFGIGYNINMFAMWRQ